MPHLLTRRTSWMPGGVSAGMVTLNLVMTGAGRFGCRGFGLGAGWLGAGAAGAAGMSGSALMLAWLKNRPSGSPRSVAVEVAPDQGPALPPAGTTEQRLRSGKGEHGERAR